MSKPATETAFEEQSLRAVGAIRWTRADVDRMEEIGILPERYELLDGEIITKMGQGMAHRRAVSSLIAWLYRGWQSEFLQSQASIDVSPEDHPTNRPEPDLLVLNQSMKTFAVEPLPAGIDLAIEVSDSSLRDDLTKKAPLYARAGIPEYWAFDCRKQVLHVHRRPVGGRYEEVFQISGSDRVAPLARPEHAIEVRSILS